VQGVREHLTKPVSWSLLEAALTNILQRPMA
jgi:hypothetical protein